MAFQPYELKLHSSEARDMSDSFKKLGQSLADTSRNVLTSRGVKKLTISILQAKEENVD